MEGIWQIWQQQRAEDRGETFEPLIDVQMRYWFNPAAISQHFIIPGAITIIMTVVGAILTSLVVAREWERGTMEALLSTEITRAELLLCKLIPYYFLGMLAMLLCMLVSVFILGVPYRGSLPSVMSCSGASAPGRAIWRSKSTGMTTMARMRPACIISISCLRLSLTVASI